MKIPGMTISHQIITGECRANRGAEMAFQEAVRRLRDAYWNVLLPGVDDQTEIHLALIVQQERHRVPSPSTSE